MLVNNSTQQHWYYLVVEIAFFISMFEHCFDQGQNKSNTDPFVNGILKLKAVVNSISKYITK